MTPRARPTRTAGLGLAAIVLAGLSWMAARPAPAARSVVLITLDTTRADRLSPYGFMNVSLPHLERMAREGVVFDQATSVAPLTLPAHASLLTGLIPPNHGVRDNADDPLAEDHTTLAETLRARGFRTGAFVGSVVLDRDRGLAQGFDVYRGITGADRETPSRRQRRADEVVDDAVQWLDTIGTGRFFLWTHLYDAHRPYDPPEPYRSTYAHDLYVGEIAYADEQVGRLLHALEERDLLDRAIVIVTADHGESLGAHGERDHGILIYEDVVRVPLIVRAAGLPQSRIGEVVRLTDVMPTVLDVLNVRSPQVDGVSLVDLMQGRRSGLDLEAYSESLYPARIGCAPLLSLRRGRFKLIDAPRPELYDLEQDPAEERNIYDERRATADAMSTRLLAIAKGREARAMPSGPASTELQARLAALGYLSTATPRRTSDRASLGDARECLAASGVVFNARRTR